MKAHEIRVSQTLELLRTQFTSVAEAVENGLYAFWLGSGISREKLDAVPVFVMTVLTFLQSRIDSHDLDGPSSIQFIEALELAELSELEKKQIDLSLPLSEWTICDPIVDRISRRYSELLDIEVPGEQPDFLLWDVLDVRGQYGNGTSDPDLEHFCLAVLIMEGVAPEIVTANWDGLIEKAVEELAPRAPSLLSVYVRSLDFRAPRGRSRLLKFHGCAVRAIDDPAVYRRMLVGRRTQITDWPRDDDHAVMRHEMTSIGVSRPTLMIGLSAQDNNIQDLFAAAKEVLPWTWPTEPSAFVFAEDALGLDQKNILRVGYRSDYQGNEEAIARASHIRAYGKPLLTALMLRVWTRKLEVLAEMARPSDIEIISVGIEAVARAAALSVDGDPALNARRLISDMGRAMALVRSGRPPLEEGSYAPIGVTPVHQMADDPAIPSSGLPEAALALSVVGNGLIDGTFVLQRSAAPTAESRPVLAIESDSGAVSRVFFAASPTAAVELALAGLVDDSDPTTILIHSSTPPTTLQRAPSDAPGRTGRREVRHIDMADLASSSGSYDELRQNFRKGFGI